LRADALSQLVKALLENRDACAAYADVEVATGDTGPSPVFFGAFDYERMLEQGYAANLFAVRISDIAIPAGEKSGSLTRLLLALCDQDGASAARRIAHVPGALAKVTQPSPVESSAALRQATAAHMRARRIAGEVQQAPGGIFPALRIQRRAANTSLVSIVIPTRDRIDLLRPCIDSIQSNTKKAKYEIVVVDNGSATEEARQYFKALRRHEGIRIVDAAGPFNYSHLNNTGVAAAHGKYVCLLNNDTEAVQPDWLEELLSRLADPTVGAVAPKLLWPNKMIQNGGVVLGPNFAASDAFNDCADIDPGYGDLLLVAHECTAVSAACMLVRREDYLALSGFDEVAFPVLFNDVDFCLRLRATGKRVVLTPHATLLHHESATRQGDQTPSHKGRFRRELAELRKRWADVLANDPLYSPFLNLDPYPYSALAWPPRPYGPRFNTVTKSASL
jgi:GT2 family glycosyltransferase